MLLYEIPGRGTIRIKNIVFDYNGTIAVDGKLLAGVKELIQQLKLKVNIYILTADTYGTVAQECSSLGIETMSFPQGAASQAKKEVVLKLGAENTMCIGNGYNDIEMCKTAALSIGVIEQEGCCSKLLLHTDIVATSIKNALEIILNPDRVKATLRN
ncbi:MAG: HAD family hydrolase [Clostridia bacterium]|jgi:P-type E1-E2 ATPase|nr:HAD family hydrolase [Clostridia bacterium]